MLRSNLVRILLAAILVVGILSIVLSIHFRTEEREPPPEPSELLPPEVSRQSTGFEFSQLKEGRVVFKVYAKTSTLTESGEHLLDEVRLVGLDDQRQVTDRVEARGALYRIDDKQIEFRKDVRIQLTDGTQILADRASADLAAETVTIPDRFQFTQGEFTGSGRGLHYHVSTKLLDADRGLDLSFHAGTAPVRAQAGSARYGLVSGHVVLRDSVRIHSGDRLLQADAVSIELTPERRVESLHAIGGAELDLSTSEKLEGQRLWISFPQSKGEVGHLVSAAADDDPANQQRARFVQTGTSGRQAMEGDRIVVPFHLLQDGGETGVRLESLSTEGDVRIETSAEAFDEGRADHSQAEFDGSTGELSHLLLTDNVRLSGTFGLQESGGGGRQTLACRSLDVRLDGPGLVEAMEAEGPVDLVVTSEQVKRRLQAQDRLTVGYRDGVVHRLTATGKCRLDSSENGDTTQLRAARMQLELGETGPRQAQASGGVQLEAKRGETTYVSTSDSLVLHYVEGIAQEAVQQGSFRLNQQTSKGDKLHLSGDEASYDVQDGLLHVRAHHRPELELQSSRGMLRTSAREIHLDRVKEEVTAEDDVQTTFDAGDRPSVVTAGHMIASLETGELTFEGSRPRLVQGSNLIRAQRLLIDSGPGNLRATGDVDSVWMDESGDSPREFQVRAESLVLNSEEQHAVYQDRVRLDSADLHLEAPRLEVFFLPPPASGLDRLEAAGGVDIVEQGRHWQAERAVYLRKTDRVVATK